MLGTTIKDFRLIARLGKGGWGEVWAAEQPIVKTRVAIKLLRSEVSEDETHVQRFFNEARAVSSIPHAGIVKIFDVGYAGTQAFLIMEMLDGEALTTRIRRVIRMPLAEVLDLGRQIASVLAATHEAGIVHRDLKPDNVFLVPDAELGERVKVLDFGIAKLSSVQVTGTGALGTPAYMAPEQWNNPATADHRADVYSLGCVLFEICCGRPPFLATSPGEACAKHLTEPPPRVRSLAPDMPAELDQLIDDLLAKQADARPTLAEVEQILATAAVAAPLHRTRPRASHPPLRVTPLTEATAETLTATAATTGPRTTETSLVGAVIANREPPVPHKRPWLALGLGAAGLAGAVTFAITRKAPLPEEPASTAQLGLAAIESYLSPTPATVINLRSEQVWLGAREDFERACKLDEPRSCAGAAFASGMLALLVDNRPAAVPAFQRATELDASWSVGYLGLADAHTHARERDLALAAARRAQELAPTSWQPAMASARAYVSVDEIDEALIEYRRAMALAPPNNAVMLAEIALAFHYAGKDAEARRLAAQASALDAHLVNVQLVTAELALEAGDGQAALTAADAALAASPKNGAAMLARGDALVLLDRDGDRRDEALATYRHALEVRGGMNTLTISRIRLAAVERALAAGELPPPRVDRSPPAVRPVTPARSPAAPVTPATTRSAPGRNKHPDDGAPRTPPTPGPIPSAATSVSHDRTMPSVNQPRTPPSKTGVKSRVKERTPPTHVDE